MLNKWIKIWVLNCNNCVFAVLAFGIQAIQAQTTLTSVYQGQPTETNPWTNVLNWSTDMYPDNSEAYLFDAVIETGRVLIDKDIALRNLKLDAWLNFGSIDTNFSISIENDFNWSGGYIRGNNANLLLNNLTIKSPKDKQTDRNSTFSIFGNARWEGGDVNATRSSWIIQETGSFEIKTDNFFGSNSTSRPDFINKGQVIMDAESKTSMAVNFHNKGLLDIRNGTLWFSDFVGGGSISVSENSTLEILHSKLSSITTSNLGVVKFFRRMHAEEDVELNGVVEIHDGVGGPGAIRIEVTDWMGGDMNDIGDFVIPDGGVFNLHHGSRSSRRIKNFGKFNLYSNFRDLGAEPTFDNFESGLVLIKNNINWGLHSWAGVLRNYGDIVIENNAFVRLGYNEFLNEGDFSVISGSVEISGMTSGSGNFYISDNSVITFTKPNFGDNSPVNWNGNGRLNVGGNITTSFTPTFSGNFSPDLTLQISGYTILNQNDNINLKSLILGGSLSGEAGFQISDELIINKSWIYGAGDIISLGNLKIDIPPTTSLSRLTIGESRRIINQGIGQLVQGTLTVDGNDAEFINHGEIKFVGKGVVDLVDGGKFKNYGLLIIDHPEIESRLSVSGGDGQINVLNGLLTLWGHNNDSIYEGNLLTFPETSVNIKLGANFTETSEVYSGGTLNIINGLTQLNGYLVADTINLHHPSVLVFGNGSIGQISKFSIFGRPSIDVIEGSEIVIDELEFFDSSSIRIKSKMVVNSRLTGNGSVIELSDGILKFGENLIVDNCSIKGFGTVNGGLTLCGGSILPESQGLYINGDLTIEDCQSEEKSSILYKFKQSEGEIKFSSIHVNGNVELNGLLKIDIDNYAVGILNRTNIFEVLIADGDITGEFIGLPNGSRVYSPNGRISYRVFYGNESKFDSNKIVITDFMPSYEGWVHYYFGEEGLLDDNLGGRFANPDGDLFVNIAEFAMLTDPTRPTLLSNVLNIDNDYTISFRHNPKSGNVVQTLYQTQSINDGSWEVVFAIRNGVAIINNGFNMEVEYNDYDHSATIRLKLIDKLESSFFKMRFYIKN